MIFQYDIKKRPSPVIVYLANPNHKIIRPLSGITKARLKTSLLDIWEIDFEVDKYLVSDTGKRFINPLYDKLSLLMELKIENLGWFRIDEMPEEHQSGERIYKSFTAFGYETTLTDLDIVGININTGAEDSVEMYDENLDVLGIPKHNIQLYIKNESDDPTSDSYWKLGLLNILEHEYLRKKGWRIGDIDIAVAPLRGRQFEIDNQSVYSFLTQDAAVAYKCLFWFDRVNKTINATKLENLGSSMNLEFTFRNVINDIEIKDKNDKYYTRFRVAGNDSDSSLIEYINYGSDKMVNIDYCIETGMLSDEIITKYNSYKEFVDSHREEYAEYSRTFMKLNEERTVYYEQTTIDEISVMYTNLSDDELQLELTTAETLKNTLLEVYGTEDAMKSSPDYQIYMSYKDVIIPKIQAEIEARKSGTHASSDAIDYEHNWELYGINELNAKLEAYNIQIDFLKEKNYDKEWSSNLGGDQIYHNKQHQLYLDYVGYVNAITARLNDLQAKVDTIDELIKENNSSQQDLASQAQIEHYSWGFTDSELSDIYALYRDTDYTDSTIEVLDTDTIDNIIELAWQLYDSAKEQMEIESHPQLIYSISLDNLFHIPQFSEKISNMSIGDFCYLELEDGFKTKQRLIGMELELVNFNDMDLSVEFSDMTTVCGKADDYRFLLESGTSSQKNSISRSTQNYIKNTASTVAEKVLANYFNSTGGSVFPTHISQSDIQKLQDALDGLIGGTLSLDELKVKLAQIDTLEADSAFIKYLETQYLVGNQADFKELRAKVGLIDDLLAGTVSAELGHLIHLTAQNVSIDEAVIKQIIAAKILVSDLQAGDITINNNMRILSEDGMMIMNGRTFQILGIDKNGNQYVAIQLGYDAENKPSLIIRDENGIVMLDGSGLHENIVPDGLIVTNMIHDGAVTEDKIDKTNIHEWTDNEGNKVFDVSNMYYGNDKFSVSYNSIKSDVSGLSTSLSGVQTQVDAVKKSITDKIWQSDISTSINEYDGSTVKTIRDRVTSTEKDISGMKTTLSDVQTTVSKKADGSTVQTLSTKFATMESNFNGFKTTVSNTYTTKEDFNNLEIGGRNLARKTSNEYCAAFNSFNGNDNICPSLAHVYLKGLSVGDKVTVRLIYKYTNIVAVTGKTAAAWIQGSGNITDWTSGAFCNSKSIVLSGSGEKIIKYSFVVTSDMIKNQYWNVNIRHDGIQSGSVQWKEFKVEKGNIATDWTPAPEDVEQSITNVSSQYTQLADKFNWIVKSGTSSSDFTITDRMISLTSSALHIDALTTFKNSAENGTSTVINGGAIKSNTITTSKLATDAIKSINYSYSSGNFSSAGTFLDLSTGLVRSKNFAIDSSGNVYLKGNIQANAGYIGGTSGWAITTNTITGNANSKIISGILESSNYVENSSGVQMNLNTGIIKGNIEATTLAVKDALQIYVGNTKRNVMTGYVGSGFFYTIIGCDLTIGNVSRVQPSIILNKSSSSNMITINTSALDIEANTSIVGSLSASDISTYTNGGSWISGKTSAAINILTSQSESSFHPVLRIQSYSGNVWCLGGLGDTIGIYGYRSGRTDNGYDWCTTWNTSNGRMYVNSLNVDGFLFGQIIELSASTPYIDFHYGSSTSDYTSRIIAVNSGILDIQQSGQWGGVRFDSQSGWFYPISSGAYSLGNSSSRWHKLWVLNGVDNSSLVDLKTQISPFTSALSEIDKTDVFNYKLKANIKHNGDDIVHTGFVIGGGYNCSDYLISESREGIDLYSAIGVTFGGVKELYEIVKQQQKTIEELKEKHLSN